MTAGTLLQIVAFGVCAVIAIAGALGMATTMSMFRSGIFLMASFFGVAGLFILLSADLLGLLQIMMYVGGMLVMILFMVLFMHDPGGAMMAGMESLTPIERWFSRGLTPRQPTTDDHAKHGHSSGATAATNAQHTHDQQATGSAQHHEGHEMHGHPMDSGSSPGHHDHGSDMAMDMSMVTPVRPLAVWLALAIGSILIALLLLRPAWPIADIRPDPDSARQIGHLLMTKYMIAFEGAGMLILIGIFGAVLMARPSRFPDDPARLARVAIHKKPLPIANEDLVPSMPASHLEDAVHHSHGGQSAHRQEHKG